MNTCVHISFPCRGYQQCSHGSMGHQMSTIRDQGYRAACQGTGGYADAGRGRKTQESSGPRVRRSVYAIFHTVIRPSKKIYMFSVRILKKKEDEGHFIFYLLFFKTAAIF